MKAMKKRTNSRTNVLDETEQIGYIIGMKEDRQAV